MKVEVADYRGKMRAKFYLKWEASAETSLWVKNDGKTLEGAVCEA